MTSLSVVCRTLIASSNFPGACHEKVIKIKRNMGEPCALNMTNPYNLSMICKQHMTFSIEVLNVVQTSDITI